MADTRLRVEIVAVLTEYAVDAAGGVGGQAVGCVERVHALAVAVIGDHTAQTVRGYVHSIGSGRAAAVAARDGAVDNLHQVGRRAVAEVSQQTL